MKPFLGLLILTFHAVATASIPVSWNQKVLPDVLSLSDVEAALQREGVSPGPLLMARGSSDVQEIKNCHDYLVAKKLGFGPNSTFAKAMESFYIQRCRALTFIQSAAPSKQSFLDHFFTMSSHQHLPICMGEMGGDSGFWEINNQQTLRGDSLAMNPWTVGLNNSSLELSDGAEVRIFDQLAYGDINGDGIEDVLMSSGSYYLEGTARSYQTYELTKNDGVQNTLKILKQSGPSLNGVVYGCPMTFNF